MDHRATSAIVNTEMKPRLTIKEMFVKQNYQNKNLLKPSLSFELE